MQIYYGYLYYLRRNTTHVPSWRDEAVITPLQLMRITVEQKVSNMNYRWKRVAYTARRAVYINSKWGVKWLITDDTKTFYTTQAQLIS
jgi:hypothetical protein